MLDEIFFATFLFVELCFMFSCISQNVLFVLLSYQTNPLFMICIYLLLLDSIPMNLFLALFASVSVKCRMSMFFFRLHNLQREEANKKKKKIELRQRRGAKVFRRVSRADLSHLTAPSRLFEKTPMNPSDSLDEIALQIPRFD